MRKLIIALALIVAACTEQPEVIPYDFSKMFTGDEKKAWTIRSFSLTEEGKATKTDFFADCVADDLYIFFANSERRVEIRNNSEKCEETDPDLIAEGTWSFSQANATLSLPFPLIADAELPFVVRSVDEDRMTLEIFFNDDKSSYRFNFRATDLE